MQDPPKVVAEPAKSAEDVKTIINQGLRELELALGKLNIEVPAEQKTPLNALDK